MDRLQAFLIGNLIGLTVLIVGIIVSAPFKLQEGTLLEKLQVLTGQRPAQSRDNAKAEAPSKNPASIELITLKHDVAKGSVLKASDVAVCSLAHNKAPAQPVATLGAAIGRKVKENLVEGEILTNAELQDEQQ